MSFISSKASLPPDALPSLFSPKQIQGWTEIFVMEEEKGEDPSFSNSPRSDGGKARGGEMAVARLILSFPFVKPYSIQAQPPASASLQALSPLNGEGQQARWRCQRPCCRLPGAMRRPPTPPLRFHFIHTRTRGCFCLIFTATLGGRNYYSQFAQEETD